MQHELPMSNLMYFCSVGALKKLDDEELDRMLDSLEEVRLAVEQEILDRREGRKETTCQS